MRQSFPRLRFVHAQKHVMMYIALLCTMLGVVPVFSQNPFVLMQVDTTDQSHPIRVILEANPRSDVASITVTADAPTNIASLSIVDRNRFVGFPIGENGIGIATTSDTGFIPRQGMLLANILTDNATLQQRFTVRFLSRNGESLYEQIIPIIIHPRTKLAPPCNRQMLDLTTGVTTSAVLLGANVVDNNWSTQQGNITGARPATAAAVYTITPSLAWSPSSSSRWLCYQAGSPTSPPGLQNGFWTSWRQFCVSRDSTRVTITLNARADDAAQVFLVPPTGPDILLGNTSGFAGTLTPIVNNMTLTAGTYFVRVVTRNIGGGPTAFRFDAGSNITINSTGIPSLGLTGTACCKPPGRVGGRKMWDKNCNGKIDLGDDAAMPNWVITATPTAGGAPITATTDASGFYSMQLFEGTYILTETMQASWNPSVSAGPYTLVVQSGQSYTRNFLNCKKPTCEELFTVGETDSVCCRGNFSISTEPGVTVTSLSFAVTGGVLTGAFSGCPSSNSLNFTGGLTSGTLLYPTGCNNMNMEFNAKSTTAHGRVCVRWTATFKQGTQTFTCFKDICINCERMPKECGEPLQVTPYIFGDLNTDWRTFKLSNVKLPLSAISSVDIAFNSAPGLHHIGGGLVAQGPGLTPIPRTWTVANSGGVADPYTKVRMDCQPGGTNPHGNAATGWVSFNLGVDKTLNYSGVVRIKIGYCDGDTCELEYTWKPKKTSRFDNLVDTLSAVLNPRLVRLKVTLPDSATSAGIRLVSSTAKILAVTAPCGSPENDCEDAPGLLESKAKDNVAKITFPPPFALRSSNITLAFLPGSGATDPKTPIQITFYDINGVEIGQAERTITSTPTSVISSDASGKIDNDVIIEGVTPNPVDNNATLSFSIMESANQVRATLLDVQGREVQVLVDNKRFDAGTHNIPFNMSTLSNGVYIIKLSVDGQIKSTKFIVAH